MTDPVARELADLRRRLDDAAAVAVLSGAGISAASGIPTFRGRDDSLWSRYRPEQLATPSAFARDPELVWRWYDWRRGLIAASAPNAAHAALVRLEGRARLQVITQNVDGYHQQAGSRDVIEYHGSIWRLRCTRCRHAAEDRRVPLPIPPRCPECEALLRPGVVWFGEGIPPAAHEAAAAAAAGCAVLLVIGTAGAVYPAAGLVDLARSHGAYVAEFNLEPSAVTAQADLFVAGSAADTVPRLLEP
jgi:NAD-dependent deacetylase